MYDGLRVLRRLYPTVKNKYRVYRLRNQGARIGKNVFIHPKALFGGKVANLFVDDESYLGASEYYLLDRIHIGKRVLIGERCYLCTGSHAYNEDFKTITSPIIIEDDVWISTSAAVLGGSVIKKGAVLGAFAVVRGYVDENFVVVGNPAVPKGTRATNFTTISPSDMGSANSDTITKKCIERLSAKLKHSKN